MRQSCARSLRSSAVARIELSPVFDLALPLSRRWTSSIDALSFRTLIPGTILKYASFFDGPTRAWTAYAAQEDFKFGLLIVLESAHVCAHRDRPNAPSPLAGRSGHDERLEPTHQFD